MHAGTIVLFRCGGGGGRGSRDPVGACGKVPPELPWSYPGATLEELPWRSYPGGATLEKHPSRISLQQPPSHHAGAAEVPVMPARVALAHPEG